MRAKALPLTPRGTAFRIAPTEKRGNVGSMPRLPYSAWVLAWGLTCFATVTTACRDNTVPIPGRQSDGDDDDEGSSSGSGGSSSSSGSGGESSSSSGSSSGQPRGPASLRLANFNTRNLFNDKDDSDTVVDETIVSTEEYQNHLSEVAIALASLDADVVMLIEVENEAVLADLVERSEIAGKYQHYKLLPGNDPRGINIGLVSNLPIENAVTHRYDNLRGALANYRYSRDVPEFHLSKNGNPFTLLGVHFKAKDASDVERDNDKRVAEAKGARALADKLLEDEANGPVVLLGDFNDDTPSTSTQAVKGNNPEFTHAVGDKPASEQWTVSYGGERMTYDDQWASPGMASLRDPSSIFILRVPAAVSDHAAVAATYEFE